MVGRGYGSIIVERASEGLAEAAARGVDLAQPAGLADRVGCTSASALPMPRW